MKNEEKWGSGGRFPESAFYPHAIRKTDVLPKLGIKQGKGQAMINLSSKIAA